ncbi:UNKNOWN [Stylonychia lemnae]|uniref:Drug metabolite transporter superfamily n=1 Tax=Stylonychia lemnae TaxID=5949 RepID=A0A078AA50_STYLE|nr:UNKNOWN [Stylonychia lemnae]|eukprot:CDW78761.1 UNKNOWN [Stylonychia lemnae]
MDQDLFSGLLSTKDQEDIKKYGPDDSRVENQNKVIPKWAYLAFIVAGASGAMDGPFSQFLQANNPFLKMAWKFQGVFFLFLIIYVFLVAIKKRGIIGQFSQWKNTYQTYLNLLIASIGLIGMQSFLSWGAAYTIMSHANLFSSLTAMLVVSYKLLTCSQITRCEIIGTVISIIGCGLTTQDPHAEKTNDELNDIAYGNILSFVSSIFATLYILKGQEESLKLDPMQYFLTLNFFTSVNFILFGCLFVEDSFYLSQDPVKGVFGWIHPENIVYSVVVVSFVNGVGTLYLQYLVFKNFSPVIAGSMMLLEPLFSQIYGIILGLDEYPGFLTYFGSSLIIVGLYLLLSHPNRPL